MQSTTPPNKIPAAFANAGARNVIPLPSQITVTPGRASYTDGFPPLTRTPQSGGGVAPFGEDMNGVLYDVTNNINWFNAGGFTVFDATFASENGGYPKGAVLMASNLNGNSWLNTVENNSTNPDAGGAGWVGAFMQVSGKYYQGPGSGNLIVPMWASTLIVHGMWGGGGGGGGSGNPGSSASGGGGSAFALATINGLLPGQILPFVVGVGGVGGVGATGNGMDGTSSTLPFITCGNGHGGFSANGTIASSSGAPGNVSFASSLTNRYGGLGLAGTTGYLSGGTEYISGAGGSAVFGGIGGGIATSNTSTPGNGLGGSGPGAGGGGGILGGSGGFGTDGLLIYEWRR